MAISEKLIEEVSAYLMTKACIELPSDVVRVLKNARNEEVNPVAISQFDSILKNVEIAKTKCKPLCQDTGVPMYYMDVGAQCQLEGDFREALVRGTAIASDRAPMRHNVANPLTMENNRDNTGWGIPVVHYDLIPGRDYVELTAIPKGFGSEMRSAHSMVFTSENIKDAVRRCVMDMVEDAMGEPCPPIIIGVGIGGFTDSVMNISKRCMFRTPIGSHNPDPMIADLEKELFEEINSLNLGPMGLGGKNYCMALNIEMNGSHASCVAIGVSYQCWCARFSTARIYNDGHVEYLTHPKEDEAK